MKIAVMGAGLSGCTIARLLKDRGHGVVIFEKDKMPGGLCRTDSHEGRLYQLYGPHNLHTHNEAVIEFVRRFSEFNHYVHRVGTVVDGRTYPYPISLQTIESLQEKDRIFDELSRLPEKMDASNFESCVVSMVGESLYKKFIENYTRKFWRLSPREMGAEWAPKRIEIRKDDRLGYYKDEWQGLPERGYTHMFEKMIEDVPVHYSSEIDDYRKLSGYDLIISTVPIDELFGFCYGRLAYRGVDFKVHFNETRWEDAQYGCINFPNNDVAYIRKCNYTFCYPNGPVTSYIVGYDFPSDNGRMYPVCTRDNQELFGRYLVRLVAIKNLLSIGRLGLFRYYDMDEAVEWCLDHIDQVERYPTLNFEQRMEMLTRVR